MTGALQSYLLAKRSVDDRAINRRVLSHFERVLVDSGGTDSGPTRVLEVGAGVGTMIARLAERDGLPPRTAYRAVDVDEDNVAHASCAVPGWLEDAGYAVDRAGGRIVATRVAPSGPHEGDGAREENGTREEGETREEGRTREEDGEREAEPTYDGNAADGRTRRRLEVSLAVGDALSLESATCIGCGPESEEADEDGRADAVIAAAFLDIVDLEAALESLGELTKSDGVLYAPLTYDGLTSFTPTHPLDDRVESLYNGHMDDVREEPGSSRAGRDLLSALSEAGYEPLAAGGADWTVFPRSGSYPRDEGEFLEAILETVAGALADYDLESDHPVYADWLETRRDQLAAGELGFVGHHLDVLARRVPE